MNISNTHNCYGCGVCAVACAKHIIEIKLNEDGFYEPQITNLAACTDCGLCVAVCSFQDERLAVGEAKPLASYAAWSKEHAVRRKCSSGGVGYELGRKLLSEGYSVCGVRYDAEKGRAEHYVANTAEQLIQSIGSKYIQSYTVDGLRAVDRKEKWLVTGTPCQIDSFRRYIKKMRCEENFVLMDFFCHSVPSMLAWKKYTAMVEMQTGKITYASWRNKLTGWHDSWAMGMDGEKAGRPTDWGGSYDELIQEKKSLYYSRLSQGDVFYKLFLGDFCVNPACQKRCKFKYDHSSADIRIGDLWGTTYQEDEDGVSAAVAFTAKGKGLLEDLGCELREHPFEVVAEGQMKKNCGKAVVAPLIMRLLHTQCALDGKAFRMTFFAERVIQFVKRKLKN